MDVEGEVSNCVETEVVLHRPDGSRVSHVQVRGSLPLHWSQKVDLAYTPRVTLPGKWGREGVLGGGRSAVSRGGSRRGVGESPPF